MVSASIVGADALAAKFEAAVGKIQAEKPYWLFDVGNIIHDAIEANIAQQGLIDTGALIDSGRLFGQTVNGISVGFGKGLDYAEPLELGAAPHEITGNPLLAFYWQNRGEWFIGPSVQHPGNKPYRFVYKGAMESLTPHRLYFMEKLRGIFGVPL
jgi:hypothetical protein